MSIVLWVALVCFVASFFDGARDAGIGRFSHVTWWRWHVVKWIAFYTPLVFILVKTLQYWALLFIVPIAMISWVLWQLGFHAGEWFYRW